MPMNKKPFDAVRMIRSIRDALSEQIKDMTFEEEQPIFASAFATSLWTLIPPPNLRTPYRIVAPWSAAAIRNA